MKRFDFAVEISKQLLTISSALVFGLATFADKIFVHEDSDGVYSMLLIVFLLLVISIGAGVLGLGALVNSAEKAENSPKSFVSVFDGHAAKFAIAQQMTVFFAFLVLLAAFGVDRWCY